MKPIIFVFGSNLAGRHGKGAAFEARKNWGAVYGVGVGRTGMAYAIPTKDGKLKSLGLTVIAQHIADFFTYANRHPELEFKVTAIGCGLAGYKASQIAPFFKNTPSNCCLPTEFINILHETSTS